MSATVSYVAASLRVEDSLSPDVLRTVNVFWDVSMCPDRLCGLVFRVLGYGSGGPGSIPGTTKKK
jgi:hypothetical protein